MILTVEARHVRTGDRLLEHPEVTTPIDCLEWPSDRYIVILRPLGWNKGGVIYRPLDSVLVERR
jgi:hypothetical protein